MKLDPIELWNNLGKKGKIAFAVGAIALAGYYLYRKHQAAVAAAAAPTDSQTSDSTSGSAQSGDTQDSTISGDAGATDPQAYYEQGMQAGELEAGGGMGSFGNSNGFTGASYLGTGDNSAVLQALTGDVAAEEQQIQDAQGNGINNPTATAPSNTSPPTGGGVNKKPTHTAHQVTHKTGKPAHKPATTHTKTAVKKPPIKKPVHKKKPVRR